MSADPAAPLPTAIESARGRVTHNPLTLVLHQAAKAQREYDDAAKKAAKTAKRSRTRQRQREMDAGIAKRRRRTPEKLRHDRLIQTARAEALRVLRERHQDEYNAILREIKDAVGLPADDLTVVAETNGTKTPCRGPHQPIKRSFGLFCGVCDTKLN